MNPVTRHFHTPREQVLDMVNHDEAVAELVPWEVLYRGLDVEADALRDRWNTRANRYAAALVGLRPEPASGLGHSATITFAENHDGIL